MSDIFRVALRGLARGRRLLVVAILLAIPALLALANAAGGAGESGDHFTIDLFANVVLPVLLPLVALIFATSALGGEIEDRTLLYLTLRPVSRLGVVLAKWCAATLIVTVLVEASLALTYLIAAHAGLDGRALGALLLAGLGGCLDYSSLFLLLGLLMPRRAVIAGFIYVLIWEGIAAGYSTALATFSVRRYVEGALHGALGTSALASYTTIDIGGLVSALVLAGIVLAGIAGSNVGLRRLELP
jgi:ABC-2 type transport system permease protein